MTIAIGKVYEAIGKITHPSIKAYAQKIGAEFVCIDKLKISETSPHYEKFQIYDLLNKYERIAFIDTDIIIREDTPNLFDIVPYTSLGIFNEGRYMDRTEAMMSVCREYEEEIKQWNGNYYNTGVMIISRIHKPLFKKPKKEIWNFYEQSWINLRILKDEYIIEELDYKFNRMCCMDKFIGESRLCSYIVHYAGVLNNLTSLIPDDIAAWKKKIWEKLRRNIAIIVGNSRLGDAVCTEPIVRHMISKCPNDNFIISTDHPGIFKHLEDKQVSIVPLDGIPYERDTPIMHFNTGVLESNKLKHYLTCDYMHMIDFLSLICLRKTLSDKDKQIKLSVSAKGISEVLDAAKGSNPSELILIHPGRGWTSKTFPKEYWNEIISLLIKNGKKIGLIGADVHPKDSVQQGTVEIDSEKCVDFRNLLGTDGLIALISMSPLLITNDSGPLHVAGGFDNQLIVIPTCKHPDLILPWRNGSKYYKTKALYKKILGEDENIDITLTSPYNQLLIGATVPKLVGYKLSEIKGNILDYLPEPSKVVEEALDSCRSSLSG